MKLKEIYWNISIHTATAQIMGLTLSVFPNNGKWDARLSTPHQRPETETGFDTADEAMRYAERVLLGRELKKYFNFVNQGGDDAKF